MNKIHKYISMCAGSTFNNPPGNHDATGCVDSFDEYNLTWKESKVLHVLQVQLHPAARRVALGPLQHH